MAIGASAPGLEAAGPEAASHRSGTRPAGRGRRPAPGL